MILKASCYLFIFISTISCKNNRNTTTMEEKVKEPKTPSEFKCYQYSASKDTVTLKIIYVGNAITGTLVYNIYEKDKNKGTIQGKMEGDVLIADYTFMSEGVNSVRQIAFKRIGNDLIEGYGETETTGDKVMFKNVHSLKFERTIKLGQIECNKEI